MDVQHANKRQTSRPQLRWLALTSLPLCLLLRAAISGPMVSAAPSFSLKNHRLSAIERRADEPAELTSATNATDIVINSLGDEHQFGQKLADRRHHYDQQSAVGHEPESTGQPEEASGTRLESRNEQQQLSEQQQQLAEQIIMDHRPVESNAEAASSSTQSPLGLSTSTAATPSTTASSSVASTTAGPFNQAYAQWVPAPTGQQVVFARQASPGGSQQQQQQFGNLMSASNQIVSTIQHPNSINAIISEQQATSPQQQLQQQQQQQQQQPMALQSQMINGQQQLVFVPQGGVTAASGINQQVVGLTANGRRMSISNWLRGLGSMLANIFNRREYGGLATNQLQAAGMMASGSAPTSHWIQLGPNAPHWLTQAQSAIQQFQQQHQQISLPGSGRFASFIQGSPVGATNGANMITIALPQQQQVSQTSAHQQQHMSDLQASGSSNTYMTIQTPTGQSLQQQQPQQQTQSANGQSVLVGQLQQSVASGPPTSQMQQQTTSSQLAAPPSHQTKASADQVKQMVVSTTSGSGQQRSLSPSTGGQGRFGRASKQQQSVAIQKTNGNLPLAHYSQYSGSDQ